MRSLPITKSNFRNKNGLNLKRIRTWNEERLGLFGFSPCSFAYYGG